MTNGTNPPRRGTPDFLFLFLTFLLVAFGLLMVFSASSMTSAYNFGGDSLHYTKRQALFIGMGIIGMFFFMNIHYSRLKKWAVPLFALVMGLLLLVAMFGKGPNGVRSWFYIGPFGLQPAEFAKLSVIVYLAHIISRKGERMRDFRNGLLPALIIVAVPSALIMLQPDLGSCLVLVLCSLIVIAVGGANMFQMALIGAGGVGLMAIAVNLPNQSYRLARFTAFLDPFADSQDTGFQLVQSLFALGHGGLAGAGIGQSILKLHYLPEAHNDFIFSVIGEELGFIGSSLFLLVYAAFLWRGIIIALRCKDTFGTLVGVGIVGMIGIQALVNLGGVTSTIPLTGVTLPFISYGGSSILVTMAAAGILLGISREHNQALPDKKQQGKPAPPPHHLHVTK